MNWIDAAVYVIFVLLIDVIRQGRLRFDGILMQNCRGESEEEEEEEEEIVI